MREMSHLPFKLITSMLELYSRCILLNGNSLHNIDDFHDIFTQLFHVISILFHILCTLMLDRACIVRNVLDLKCF